MLKHFLFGIILGIVSVIFSYAIYLFVTGMSEGAGSLGYWLGSFIPVIIFGLLGMLVGWLLDKVLPNRSKQPPIAVTPPAQTQ